ncbi:hypothetical protein Hanom_Chr12g01067971 [Helianthus anomalus]
MLFRYALCITFLPSLRKFKVGPKQIKSKVIQGCRALHEHYRVQLRLKHL